MSLPTGTSNLRQTELSLDGTLNDYALSESFDYFVIDTATAGTTITGMSGFGNTGGRVVYIVNNSAEDVVLANQSESSLVQNRIITPTEADYTLSTAGAREVVQLIYDQFANAWRMRVGA